MQHLYDLVKDQDDVTLQLPIKGDVDGYIADAPSMEDGVFYGGMDSSEGAVILRYGVDDVAAFEAYIEKLEDEGYSAVWIDVNGDASTPYRCYMHLFFPDIDYGNAKDIILKIGGSGIVLK